MEFHGTSARPCSSASAMPSEDEDLRRGPWTVEEDILLVNYIAAHGDGRWNSLAQSAGLKRTGKSCRLRWLNYLRPDVRRGNITPQELLLILELHSRWGNKWSKIAQHLPGRTDNEIKNYWRTRVQKHAKQLRCDVNSKQFKDIMRYLWVPRLVERIRATSHGLPPDANASVSAPASAPMQQQHPPSNETVGRPQLFIKTTPESSSTDGCSSEYSLDAGSWPPPAASDVSLAGSCVLQESEEGGGDVCWMQEQQFGVGCLAEPLLSPGAYGSFGLPELEQGACWKESLWNIEDLWLQQQF